MWLRIKIQTVLWQKFIITAHDETAMLRSPVVGRTGFAKQCTYSNIERGDSVIEIDTFKFELSQYESPLQEVRDSL